jgi:hypothetical protein
MTNTTRIATLSLNPAIDQTARVPNFTAGRVNRVEWEQSDAGGKGVNVASFLADAGLPVAATGLLGSANAEPFVELFARKGIEDRCVRLPGRTRVNVKIVDAVLDQVTDINFPGLAPAPADLDRLMGAIDALCPIPTGSYSPAACPPGSRPASTRTWSGASTDGARRWCSTPAGSPSPRRSIRARPSSSRTSTS